MIRLFHGLVRREGVTLSEFRSFLSSKTFEELIVEGSLLLGASRFQQTLKMNIALDEDIEKIRGSQQPYSGTIEYWWEKTDAIPKTDSPEFENWLSKMEKAQKPFIDLQRSCLFFTDWE